MNLEELTTLADHSKAVVEMVKATAFCGKTRMLNGQVAHALAIFLKIYPNSPLARFT
jgi:hypothetical protein